MTFLLQREHLKHIRANIDYWQSQCLKVFRNPDADVPTKSYWANFLIGVNACKKALDDGGVEKANAELRALLYEFITLTKRKATIPAHAIAITAFLSCTVPEYVGSLHS